MASTTDICNLAVAHFGGDARISSIDPPDSAEAEHCQRFYPVARDELLEYHPWTFASKRATLAQLVGDRLDFAYRYTLPADCLRPRLLLPDGYTDEMDEAAGVVFTREGDSVYCDAANATLVYTFKLTNTTKFSPTFVTALSFLLASYIIGPIVKDASGRSQRAMRATAEMEMKRAAASDANSDRRRAVHRSTAQRTR